MLTKERVQKLIDDVAQSLPLIPIIGDGPNEPINPRTAIAYLEGYGDGLRAAHAALERFRVKLRDATDQLRDYDEQGGKFSTESDWL